MELSDWVVRNEMPVRLGLFIAVFALIALWELRAPRRRLAVAKAHRWINNLGLVLLNALILRVLFPAAALASALAAERNGWGLLNGIELPLPLAVAIAVVVLDLAIYLQHVMFHAIPLLWRLHRVHHADLDVDVTTGARFHPIEMVLSLLIKLAVITLLGPPVVAVLVFEVLLNATAMFNHGNVHIPERLDRRLRWLVVTPDMHRVHHSVHTRLSNSNFGFNLPWWDRLFGTYVAQPPDGHAAMTLGIAGLRDPGQVDTLRGMLVLPFVRAPGDHRPDRSGVIEESGRHPSQN